MKKNMALFVVILVAAFIVGCSKDLSVLREVKGSTFYIDKPEGLKQLHGKAFDLFVVELVKAGSVETKKFEEADFKLTAGNISILFGHRRAGVLWDTKWPNAEYVGFLNNARDKAGEFRDFLTNKEVEPKK